MNAVLNKKESGFTIIEVVLVLAIAGLIFLMVFIALPTLQRNSRDTQRKNDVSRVKTSIGNYSSSSKGKIPNDLTTFNTLRTNFLVPADEYSDPKFGNYTFVRTTAAPGDGQITYQEGNVCGDAGTLTGGGLRDYAIRIKLEGQSVPYCMDSK